VTVTCSVLLWIVVVRVGVIVTMTTVVLVFLPFVTSALLADDAEVDAAAVEAPLSGQVVVESVMISVVVNGVLAAAIVIPLVEHSTVR